MKACTLLFFLTVNLLAIGIAPVMAADLELANLPNSLRFDKAVLNAKRGEQLRLSFKNADPTDGSGMAHSFILTKPGREAEAIQLALKAGEAKGYIPEGELVLASSRLLKPGETQVLIFKAPAVAGDYPFFCGFPGHAALMKGVLKVK